jgi:hypothetical protein
VDKVIDVQCRLRMSFVEYSQQRLVAGTGSQQGTNAL